MKSIGEISIATAGGRISGILVVQRSEEVQPQELQHSGPKGKRDRLHPFLALRFSWAGGEYRGVGRQGHPSLLIRAVRYGKEQVCGGIDIDGEGPISLRLVTER